MSLDNYSQLQATVADWIDRTDLATKIPTFIRLAEAKFNRKLRTAQQQATATLNLTGDAAPLPADFAELIYVSVPESPARRLRYVTEDERQRLVYELAATGRAEGYTIRGSSLIVAPGPGGVSTLDIGYYRKLTPLSNANPTNWLLTDHPDAYLFGACLQAAPYLRDSEQLAVWSAGLEGVMAEIEDADKRARYNGSPLLMRAPGFRG